MFKWLFTKEHHEAKAKRKAERREPRTNPLNERVKRFADTAHTYNSSKITQVSRNNNSTNIIGNGHSYQRSVVNGKETIIVDGKVLTGNEAKQARKDYESWKEDFNDMMDDFKDDMRDFKDDMRDMAKEMRDMFK